MTRGNLLQLPFVPQTCGQRADLVLWGCYQMQSADEHVIVRINRRGGLQNFFDPRMRTANHQQQSERGTSENNFGRGYD